MTSDLSTWNLILGLANMCLIDFFGGNMWVTVARGIPTAEVAGVSLIQMRRWVVRIKTPDLSDANWGLSSHSTSTEERSEDSTSPGSRTGRPLLVSCALRSHFSAITYSIGRND